MPEYFLRKTTSTAAQAQQERHPLANTDPIHVGVLFSRAGITSRVEYSQLLGTDFAIH
jgi:hypothetical protein